VFPRETARVQLDGGLEVPREREVPAYDVREPVDLPGFKEIGGAAAEVQLVYGRRFADVLARQAHLPFKVVEVGVRTVPVARDERVAPAEPAVCLAEGDMEIEGQPGTAAQFSEEFRTRCVFAEIQGGRVRGVAWTGPVILGGKVEIGREGLSHGRQYARFRGRFQRRRCGRRA